MPCRAVVDAEADLKKANELLQQCARAEVAAQGKDSSSSNLRTLVEGIAKGAWSRIKHIWWLVLSLEWIEAFQEIRVGSQLAPFRQSLRLCASQALAFHANARTLLPMAPKPGTTVFAARDAGAAFAIQPWLRSSLFCCSPWELVTTEQVLVHENLQVCATLYFLWWIAGITTGPRSGASKSLLQVAQTCHHLAGDLPFPALMYQSGA